MNKIVWLLFLVLPSILNGQYLLGIHTEYDDSFREWVVVVEQDSIEIEGSLRVTWGLDNDFRQWQYSIGDKDGEIQQKFPRNQGFWELRSGNILVTIRQVWTGDPTEWDIKKDGRTLKIRTVQPGILDEWSNTRATSGDLFLYTSRLGDPRDWIIEDYMNESYTFEERLAAVFIAILKSTPNY